MAIIMAQSSSANFTVLLPKCKMVKQLVHAVIHVGKWAAQSQQCGKKKAGHTIMQQNDILYNLISGNSLRGLCIMQAYLQAMS